jgi:hypothetical protein
LAKQSKVEVIDIIYNCSKVGIEVHLKVEGEYSKGLFGKKFINQVVKECDLQSQGGCTVRLDPAISSKCPAVAKALKSSLK